jgi:hypothetical protein
MNAYGNGNILPGPSAPDIRAMLNASFAEEQEPTSAMLARAMIYAQDADRKLEEAKVVRSQAEKYRAEMQRTTVAQTEAGALPPVARGGRAVPVRGPGPA